jgi:tRNA(Ile2) C34 agmatinyltransferase TiaS
MSRRHLHNLCALLDEGLDVEHARNEYLASLDADDGLAVLLIPRDEILAAARARPRVPRCERCGARLSRKRHRCSRCGLRQM